MCNCDPYETDCHHVSCPEGTQEWKDHQGITIGQQTIAYKELWKVIKEQAEESKHDQGTYSINRALNGVLVKARERISVTTDNKCEFMTKGQCTDEDYPDNFSVILCGTDECPLVK